MYKDYLKLEGKPFTDATDEYQAAIYENHKYRHTINGVKKRLGTSIFGSMTNPDVKLFLIEISNKTYSYVKSESRRENYDVIEYRIAKMNWRGQYQAREDMLDAQLALITYATRSGGDMLGDHHGVNLKKGTVIVDWDKLRRKLEVSSSVDRILREGNQAVIMVQNLTYDVDPADYRSDY